MINLSENTTAQFTLTDCTVTDDFFKALGGNLITIASGSKHGSPFPKPIPFEDTKVVSVTFGKNPQYYEFYTQLDLKVGYTYKIFNEDYYAYKTPATVREIKDYSTYSGKLSFITDAALVSGAPIKDDGIQNVYFNYDKGTTTIKWKDGTITTVTCDINDSFDEEKGIALCYMKKYFDNRGCFNRVFKKYCGSWEEE